jgi:large subunit ribosomal protein L2
MGIKTYRPHTPGLRQRASITFEELTTDRPNMKLAMGSFFKAGRGSGGRISVRRKGGRHKRKYREIDFRRDKSGVPGKVVSIEYDPNRSANIALIAYADGDKRYILAPRGFAVGRQVQSGPASPLEAGNALPMVGIPLGMQVHNVELQLGKGGQLVRAAGTSATIVAKEGDYVTVRLPSGEMRMVFHRCMATLGEVGNEDHMNISLGKNGFILISLMG